MAHFNNEAEFAGVLGHELGHITAKHSAKQYTKQMLSQIVFMGGIILSEDFRKYADLASTGLGLLFLKFSRDNESESDKLGVEYSTEVGYNADEMAGFFRTLQKLSGGEGGSIPSFLSTHPDPGDRFNAVSTYANKLQQEKNLNDAQLKVNREQYLAMIDGLIYGEDPRQGYVEGSTFYHPEMLFSFNVPANWQTINTPSQVQMAPKDGKAVLFLQLAAGNNLQTAASETVNTNKISVTESSNTTVNGLAAIAIAGEIVQESGDPQNSQVLKVLCYLIQYNGVIYKLTGLSTKADFLNYVNSFSTSMKSFKQLTDQSKINVYPDKLQVVKTNKSATFQQHMTDFNMPANKVDELAVINGLEKNVQVPAGTSLKIVQKSTSKN
jgi:predicted Zn-dependent protease